MEIGKFYKDNTLGFIQVITPIDKDGMVRVKRIYGYSKWVKPRKYWEEVTMTEMIERGVIKKGDLVKCWDSYTVYGCDVRQFIGVYNFLPSIKKYYTSTYDELESPAVYDFIIPIWALSPAEIEHLNK